MIRFERPVSIEELRAIDPYYYVATPYSKYPEGLFVSYELAVWTRALLIRHGIPNFVPIVHSHPPAIRGGFDPKDHSIWLKDDEPFMRTAGGLIVVKMPGWDESFGIAAEVNVFAAAGKPIHYMEWPQ